uniref:Uncharacterized protein n=1 Tax=Hemiselmis tepida TaxID=464990 RepID=A0A7S0VJ45_9CRYP|mmetsp:Transcript_18091/g.45583  ORF Transcript_18091/g.45583 Transcript_18091/m.45583 type:complete len:341 (+) Transcript_18091:177-1199(+)
MGMAADAAAPAGGKGRGGPVLQLEDEPGMWDEFVEQCSTYWMGVRFAFTAHAIFMVALTCILTMVCSKAVLDFSFDTSMGIVAVGTVFPLVFSVQSGFARRERALGALAGLKASSITVYLMFKTWEKEGTGKWADEAERLIARLLDDIEWYLRTARRTENTGNAVYDSFAHIAAKMAEFAPAAGFGRPGDGGMSRMSQYLRTMMQNFEGVRAIRDSETPVGLRLFCFALIHAAPILLAPYWNHFCQGKKDVSEDIMGTTIELTGSYGCQAGYFMAVAYTLIVVALFRVQVELEDPFDGNGADDIKWEIWRAQLDQLGNYGVGGPEKRAENSRRAAALRGQ